MGSVAIQRQNVYQMSGVGSRWWKPGQAGAGIERESAGSVEVRRDSSPQELITRRGIGIEDSGTTGMDDFQSELDLVGGRQALPGAR
jgi:hypothetical protein